MIRLILIFAILSASLFLGLQLHQDAGYVLIQFHGWTIETTLAVALIALMLCFIVFEGLFSLTHLCLKLPSRIKLACLKLRRQSAHHKTQQGLIEFSEGYWLKAQKHLIDAVPNSDLPLLNYLTAARAAQELGELSLRDEYLRRAQKAMPDAQIAVELTQAQLQLANHQCEQSLATLKHLEGLAPKHPYVLKLLSHLYEEIKDWPALHELFPKLKKNKVFSPEMLFILEKKITLEMLNLFANSADSTQLEAFFQSLPRSLKKEEAITHAYIQALLPIEPTQAAHLLHAYLKHQFSEPLVALYAKIDINEKQLCFIDSLLKAHPNNSALHLCIARLALKQKLWGKAKHHFELALANKPSPEAYLEYGQLLEQQFKQTQLAKEAYQKGLSLVMLKESDALEHYH